MEQKLTLKNLLRIIPGLKGRTSDLIFAYGRDPFFSGWPDTVQLDYSNPASSEAMLGEILRISGQCDGVRCDMAMLVLPEVFERTWGRRAQPFWPDAIKAVREKIPAFASWQKSTGIWSGPCSSRGLIMHMINDSMTGLCEGHARAVREHFYAGTDYQDKLARFLENHDEPRAASTFDQKVHESCCNHNIFITGFKIFPPGTI